MTLAEFRKILQRQDQLTNSTVPMFDCGAQHFHANVFGYSFDGYIENTVQFFSDGSLRVSYEGEYWVPYNNVDAWVTEQVNLMNAA